MAFQNLFRCYVGDCVELMRTMPEKAFHTCVTSPPYYGLRDYGVDGQIGLEPTPEEFIEKLVGVFREVRRVLRDDGTLWVNIGDSYATGGRGGGGSFMDARSDGAWKGKSAVTGWRSAPEGMKHKDLMGIPWMLAFALRADGWYLRQDIIWHKPNPMPESVRDRCTKAHEYIFLFSKSPRYYFDHVAFKEPAVGNGEIGSGVGWNHSSKADPRDGRVGRTRSKRDSFKRGGSKREQAIPGQSYGTHRGESEESTWDTNMRNRRSVWTIATRPLRGAHFATFPPALVEPCILAGTSEKGHCPACGERWVRKIEREFVPQGDVSAEKGFRGHGDTKPMDASNSWQGFARGMTRTDTVGWAAGCQCGLEPVPDVMIDPFGGSGTSAGVAVAHGRKAVLCELNPAYAAMVPVRVNDVATSITKN
ncbi:Modification methylase XcyI (modular protein) [Enterobacterales bacterium 8AC]|nr:Modification methylase XcyI (modular protein) [Enterobacterales bacterium 8AC]